MEPVILIFPDIEELSRLAAEFFVQEAKEAVREHGRFLTALCGGGTPQPLYRLLGRSPYREQMPWADTFVFWGDERLVPPADPGSNFGMTAKLLLNEVPIPPENIFRALGEAEPGTAVADYRQKLAGVGGGTPWPRFDLILLGLGHDGHTASLFPGASPAAERREPVMAVTAEYDGRPAQRLTFTPKLINQADYVCFLVTGSEKAEALTAVLDGEPDPETWPAQRIKPTDGSIIWFVDEAAAALLK